MQSKFERRNPVNVIKSKRWRKKWVKPQRQNPVKESSTINPPLSWTSKSRKSKIQKVQKNIFGHAERRNPVKSDGCDGVLYFFAHLEHLDLNVEIP